MTFLSGFGVWGYLGALAIGLAAGGGLAWEVKAGVDSGTIASVTDQLDKCNLARETTRANANQKTVDALTSSISRALDANAQTLAAWQAREASLATLEGKIRALPVTRSCAASPAMRALFDSVRSEVSPGNSNPTGLPGPPRHDMYGQPAGSGH